MVTANGKAPAKISYNDIVGSLSVLFITKHEIPRGGVNKPISAPITVTIPNHTRSMPNSSSARKNNGTTIRIIDAVSIIVPSNNNMMT